jgi:hypothetical protein
MPIRVECTTEGLEANWIEVDDVWTRRELQAFITLQGEAYWALWARKVTACHLPLAGGDAIEHPAQVVAAQDDLDIRLLRWLASAVLLATQTLLNLGEASARLSSDGAGVAVRSQS